MEILVLIISIVMLLLNLSGYRNFFKSSSKATKELKESFGKVDGEKKDQAKGLIIVVMLVITIFYTTFYVVSGTILDSKITLLIASILTIRVWVSFFRAARNVANEEIRYSLINRIMAPVSTAYIVYFIYTYLTM
jgi:uncharacterized membrane protein YqhA